MRERSKNCLKAVFIVSIVMFALWLAAFLTTGFLGITLNPADSVNPAADFVKTLQYRWDLIKNAFTGLTKLNFSAYETGVMPIVLIASLGIIVASLIAGPIVVGVKKHGNFSIYAIAIVLVALPVVDMIVFGNLYINTFMKGYAQNLGTGKYPFYFAVLIALFALACLAFAFIYMTYILGLIYACKFPGKAVAAPEEAVLPEAEPVAAESVNEAITEQVDVEAEVEPEPEPLPYDTVIMAEEPPVEEEAAPAPVEETTVEEAAPAEEAPVEEAAPAEEIKEEKKDDAISQSALAAMLREVVRDIVRDEIARNNANQPAAPAQAPTGAQTITGATFGGPLVVQYFNGGINGVTPAAPAPAPAPVAEPAPAPAPVTEPAPAPAPVEAPKAEEAPKPVAVVHGPKTEPVVATAEKKVIERIPFPVRLLAADKELQASYNEIKNEILSWGVKSRVSNSGDSFRLHTKTYVKLVVAGKSLKLYFALNPQDYANTTIPVQDAGKKSLYAEIPLVFKVKSGLSVRRCKQLIQDCMEKDGLEQGEVGTVNWIKELKAEMAASKK